MWRVATVNVTAWSSFVGELKRGRFEDLDCILIQEHRLRPMQVHPAHMAAKLCGWKADFTEADATMKGGVSAGVGILVRQHVGLRRLEVKHDAVHVPYNSKCGVWVTTAGSRGSTLLSSVYLHTGQEDAEVNMCLLHQVGGIVKAAKLPFVLGADWQMEPRTLEATKWLQAIGGRLVAAGRPTCSGGGGIYREIDYLVVHSALDTACVRVMDEVVVRPHRPVACGVRLGDRSAVVRVVRKPRPFSPRPLVGPSREPRPWLEAGVVEDAQLSFGHLQKAACAWMEGYENEMIEHFGLQDESRSYTGRAIPPAERMRTVPAVRHNRGDVCTRASDCHWAWLHDRLQEWRHLQGSDSEGARGHAFALHVKLKRYRPPCEQQDEAWARWRHGVRHLYDMDEYGVDELLRVLAEARGKAESKAAYARYKA